MKREHRRPMGNVSWYAEARASEVTDLRPVGPASMSTVEPAVYGKRRGLPDILRHRCLIFLGLQSRFFLPEIAPQDLHL